MHFLKERRFDVKVGDAVSEMSPICTGVPQGSSISPILFGIFINDIPLVTAPEEGYSLLFADDLTVSFIFNNIKIKDESVSNRAQTYLDCIQKWLSKWRLRMAPQKCNYTIFSKGNRCPNKDFGLYLSGERIPYEKNPVSLGITFDEGMNFKAHVQKLKANCSRRLNIVKILSHKSWQLSTKTLLSIYKTLIGSVTDYSAFISPRLSEAVTTSLQAIQNRAVRSIFHLPWDEHTVDLCDISKLPLVQVRMAELNRRYFRCAKIDNNPLISTLFREYRGSFAVGTELVVKTLLCDHSTLLANI